MKPRHAAGRHRKTSVDLSAALAAEVILHDWELVFPQPVRDSQSLQRRPLYKRHERPHILPDLLEIRFRNLVKSHSGPESRCTVCHEAIRPHLDFPYPDTDFHFRTLGERDCHFDITSTQTNIRDCRPERRSVLAVNLYRIMALVARMPPHLREFRLVIVGSGVG